MNLTRTGLAKRCIASIVIALFIAEGALRLIGLGDPVLLQQDSSCGYLARPNQQHFRFFVHTRINGEGMRSDPITERKANGVYRIMFVGDSITYGTTYVDQNSIFCEILHRELPKIIHRPVEVLNASASAWAIGNELGYVKSRGTFQSDRLVLVLNDGDLDQRTSTSQDVGSQLYFTKPSCAICELIHHFASRARSDRGSEVEKDNRQNRKENLISLDILQAFVSSSGSQMILLFVPFRKDITYPGKKLIQSELSDWATRHQVPIVDATRLLGDLSIPAASIDGGIHLSALGNQAVANAFQQQYSNLCRAQDCF